MKNKFFACFKLIPISIFCFVVCVSAFLICICVDGLPEPTYLLVISIVLLIALPAVLVTIFIIVGCIMIEVTKEGIATVLFGKRLKFFNWEEISKVEITQSGNGANHQISFSRDRNTNSGKKRRNKSRSLFMIWICQE